MKNKILHQWILFLLVFLSLYSLLSLLGCSDSVPSISSITATLVLDYSQENVPPKQRLSVFLLPNSDASRCKNLQVEYSKKNIIWNIEKPMLIGSNQTYYVGSAFLEPPYFGNIPIGFYKITYQDEANRTVTTDFSVQYQSNFVSYTIEEIKEKTPAGSIKEMIAIYEQKNGEGKLLYYGIPKEDWLKEYKTIKNEYSNASSIRICLEIFNRNILCLYPIENL